MKSILIIGNSHDKHLSRFIIGLRKRCLEFEIDIFDVSMRLDACENHTLYNNVFLVKRTFPSFCYKILFISKLIKYLDVIHAFDLISDNYDIINVQFITIQAGFLAKRLKKCRAKVIVTPWGSDIYRISFFQNYFTTKLLSFADYVTLMPHSKFGNFIKQKYNVLENKSLPLCFGSDVLDAISDDKHSDIEAKQKLLGSADNYTIVIGYNASAAQNHLRIIDSLYKIKDNIPDNTLLLLPMTYGKVESYMIEVKNKLNSLEIPYIIFDNYLNDEEVVYLRKATDLLIHMQKTDAYSSSLQETLFCGKNVINAEWLRYPELEQFGLPYCLSSFDYLAKNIMQIINVKEATFDSNSLKKILESYKWSTQISSWINTINQILFDGK